MAQSRRNHPADPAKLYRAHAEEASGHHAAASAAGVDLAATHFSHAAGHHMTAARLMGHILRLQERAIAYRSAAAQARTRRREDVAAEYDRLAADAEAGARYAPTRAEHFHNMGLERSAEGHAARVVPEDEPAETVAETADPAPVHASHSVATFDEPTAE